MNNSTTMNNYSHDKGDNSWMMTSTALVLLMTPALAFFYGGLVDRKNTLNQLFLSFICMGIVFVQWVLFGFSFVFGSTAGVGFGSFAWSVLRFGETDNGIYSSTYPLLTYAAYQGTFAIITSALISGAIVGRMKLFPYMIFTFIWTTVCYDTMAHWVWSNNGWLKNLGTLDFAGGTIVHILSGVSGLVAAIILGKRSDYNAHSTTAHNLPFTILGTCLLWVGWSGFNGGSANEASGLAALAVINTHAAAGTGLVTWVILDALRGRVSISGACIGPIVGLVAITPACGFVQPGWALFISSITTCIIYFLLLHKHFIHFDDTLNVAIVHGCGGITGAFMTGLFAEQRVNPAGGYNGAFYGRPIQLWYQIAGILTAIEHGESWILEASRTIGDLARTILKEQCDKKEEASGRFKINEKICLSISGHHEETWTPTWGVRTALLAIIGFMETPGEGAIGSLDYTSDERRVLAKRSQSYICPTCDKANSELLLPLSEKSIDIQKQAKSLANQIHFRKNFETTSNNRTAPKSSSKSSELRSNSSNQILILNENNSNSNLLNSIIFICCIVFLFLFIRRLFLTFGNSQPFSSSFTNL
ncbi:unnamed protein product [Rotaria sp. Silwood1]|nr:unnamed protein product [Rotaria sp. Silwood1]